MPYYPSTSGTYESCVIDGGSDFESWGTLSWSADLPSGTSATFETRSSSDGSSWSGWSQVSTSGGDIPSPDENGERYLQYRISVTTSDDSISPQIDSLSITYDYNSPSAVTLASFSSAPAPNGIAIEWETASELNNIGFYLYRSTESGGITSAAATQLNQQLIPSQALGSVIGATYRFQDTGVVPGVQYYYWLEALDTGGERQLYGPHHAILLTQERFSVYVPLLAQ